MTIAPLRRTLALALLTLAVSSPLHAQEAADPGAPLDAEGFDARTVGRTITYSAGGFAYGTEQYLPGRKVLWAFEGDICKEGTWFQDGQYICFDYQDENGLQCWTFFDTPQGLMARFRGDPASEPLVSLGESPKPLSCQGPDVGT